MAITFEEKSNNSRAIVIILVMVVALSAGGFFLWKLYADSLPVDMITPSTEGNLDDAVLNDPRLDALELFPQVPPTAMPSGKSNPFVEGSSTSTSTAEAVDSIPVDSVPADTVSVNP